MKYVSGFSNKILFKNIKQSKAIPTAKTADLS